MLSRLRMLSALALGIALTVGSLSAADLTSSLKAGTPDLKSAGPLAFGPEGILFVGDPRGAAIFAVDTGDRAENPNIAGIKVENIDEKIGALLGTNAKGILINDIVVNPASGKAYMSVSRGRGPDAAPVIVRVDAAGKVDEFPLKDVKFSKANLPNASEKQRQEAITQIAFVKDRVIVAGLSNEQFASRLRAIPFPFTDADKGTSVEIFHGAHGRFETNAPIRTFVPYDIGGEPYLLAAYTCTPLVKVPLSELKAGAHVKGTTVAELGNRNRPLDMVVYQKGGKDYILMANSARGLMKIPTENVDKTPGIIEPVRGGGKAGLSYETLENWKNNVQQMTKLDKDHVLLLVTRNGGSLNLETIEMP